MSISLIAVADSISKVSVAGLTIMDVDEIPTGLTQRFCPALIPNPENYVSNVDASVDSFGTGASRKMTLSYWLNYLLIYSEVGAGRTATLEAYSGMLSKVCAFLDAFYALDSLTGAVDFHAELGSPQITEVGSVDFHSIAVRLMIKEFIN